MKTRYRIDWNKPCRAWRLKAYLKEGDEYVLVVAPEGRLAEVVEQWGRHAGLPTGTRVKVDCATEDQSVYVDPAALVIEDVTPALH